MAILVIEALGAHGESRAGFSIIAGRRKPVRRRRDDLWMTEIVARWVPMDPASAPDARSAGCRYHGDRPRISADAPIEA
jgi:hypothetical protein